MENNEKKSRGTGERVLEAALWMLILTSILYYLLTH